MCADKLILLNTQYHSRYHPHQLSNTFSIHIRPDIIPVPLKRNCYDIFVAMQILQCSLVMCKSIYQLFKFPHYAVLKLKWTSLGLYAMNLHERTSWSSLVSKWFTNKTYKRASSISIHTVKPGGGSIQLSGCISSAGCGKVGCQEIDGTKCSPKHTAKVTAKC